MTKKEIRSIRVENFQSNNWNDIANQFIITTSGATLFQSYTSIIAIKWRCGKIELWTDWNYSMTTGKYRNKFLWEPKKETQENIDSWLYKINLKL